VVEVVLESRPRGYDLRGEGCSSAVVGGFTRTLGRGIDRIPTAASSESESESELSWPEEGDGQNQNSTMGLYLGIGTADLQPPPPLRKIAMHVLPGCFSELVILFILFGLVWSRALIR